MIVSLGFCQHYRKFGGSLHGSETSYHFRINDGKDSPEPAYNETKASILRRRNTMAKMIHAEEQHIISNIKDPRSRSRASYLHGKHRSLQRRHYSYPEIPTRPPWPSTGSNSHFSATAAGGGSMGRRWNSVSNDELMAGHLPAAEYPSPHQLSSNQILYHHANGNNYLIVPTGPIHLNSSFSSCE